MNDNNPKPEQWIILNQKSKICSHTKLLQHQRVSGFDALYLICSKCKTLWGMGGDE
jgi:hypothetical protein